MRKTILIGMIAVAMLFSFTACEQQTVDVLGYEPTMVTVTQNGEILAGQTMTADMFTGTVTYRNGETAPIAVELSNPVATKGVTATATVSSSMKAVWNVDVTPVESYVVTAEFSDVEVISEATQTKSFTGKITSLVAQGGNSSYEVTDTTGYVATASLTKDQRVAIGTYNDLDIVLTKDKDTLTTESKATIKVVAEVKPVFVGYDFKYETTDIEGYWINKPITYAFTYLYEDEEDNVKVADAQVKQLFSATPAAGKLFVTSYEADGNAQTKETFSALPTSFGVHPVVISYIEVDHPERGEKEITIPAGQNYTVGLAKNSSSVANGDPAWATTATKAAAEAGNVTADMINMYVEKASEPTTPVTVSTKDILSQKFQTSTWSAEVLVTYPDEINGTTVSKIVSISLSTTDLK